MPMRFTRAAIGNVPTYAFPPESKSAGHCYGMADRSPWLIALGSSPCCCCSVGIPTATQEIRCDPDAATAVISCVRCRGFPLTVLVRPKALLVTHQRPTRLRSTTRHPRRSSLGGPLASLRCYWMDRRQEGRRAEGRGLSLRAQGLDRLVPWVDLDRQARHRTAVAEFRSCWDR
jgi:hypothetical protein